MASLVGAVLVLGALYFSALSFTLRSYSRARLSTRWTEVQQQTWLPFLERNESQFQYLCGFMRIAASLGIMGYCYFQWLPEWSAHTIEAFVFPTLIALGVLLVAALAVPHALAIHTGEALLAASLPLLGALRIPFLPLSALMNGVEWVVRRLLGKSPHDAESSSTRIEQDILEAVSEGEIKGAVREEQKEMIESVIGFHGTSAGEIMTPRTDIFAVPATVTYDEARRRIVDAGHSRIPVYDGTLDHIVGVLYAKDLLGLDPHGAFDVRKVMRTAPYVPATKPLDDLLDEFRTAKVQIAIVLDEYGGTAGLVTLEDILEELVGEIDDEYDQTASPPIRRLDGMTIEADARVHVYDINKELDLNLPEDGTYETIGGFLFSAMGRIPARGDQHTHENLRFTVLDAEVRRINRVKIELLAAAQPV